MLLTCSVLLGFLLQQVGSLRGAMAQLTQWRSDHEETLRALGMVIGLASADQLTPSGTARGDGGDPNPIRETPASAASARSAKRDRGDLFVTAKGMECEPSRGHEIKMDKDSATEDWDEPKKAKKITLQNLSACIHAAEKIAVGRSLKEVREMRTVLQRVNDWIEQCQSLCPRRQSKRRIQPTNKPTFKRLEAFIAEGLGFPIVVCEEVARIRKHIAEAESWQLNAQSVLGKVSRALAEQTAERMDLWRKEEDMGSDKNGLGNDKNELAQDDADEKRFPAGNDSKIAGKTPNQAGDVSKNYPHSSCAQISSHCYEENETRRAEQDIQHPEDDGDSLDREEELDEAEESHEEGLTQLLTTARDISVFMSEEMVTEKIQKIMEWGRYGTVEINMLHHESMLSYTQLFP